MRPRCIWTAVLLLGCGTDPEAVSVSTSEDGPRAVEHGADRENDRTDPSTFQPQKIAAEDESNESEPNDDVWYVPTPMSWQAAKSRAPRGYHLPTRAELVAAVDVGRFQDSGVSVGSVWSGTTDRSTSEWAWRVNLNDGYLDSVDKQSTLPVVYLRNR